LIFKNAKLQNVKKDIRLGVLFSVLFKNIYLILLFTKKIYTVHMNSKFNSIMKFYIMNI